MSMIFGAFVSVLLSIVVIVIICEIIPLTILSKKKTLVLAGRLAPITKFLLVIFSPLCYPVSKALDKVIGEYMHSRYMSSNIRALIESHTYNALMKFNLIENEESKSAKPRKSYSKHSETNLMITAGDMKEKKIVELMIPLKGTFMIDYDDPLDKFKLNLILERGYSRIPVYSSHNKMDIVGIMRIKKLIGVDFNQNKSLRQLGIPLSKPIVVAPHLTILDLLREFGKGMSHMAFITEQVNELIDKLEQTTSDNVDKNMRKESFRRYGPIKILGIITLEDVIEKMINLEILDEEDYQNLAKKNKIQNGGLKLSKKVSQELANNLIRLETEKINNLLKESYSKNTFKDTFFNKTTDMNDFTMRLKDPLI